MWNTMKSKIYNITNTKIYAAIFIAFVVYVMTTVIALGLLDYLLFIK